MYQAWVRTIGDQLIQVFEGSGLSMSELAERVGIERTKLVKRFQGKHSLKTGAGSTEPETIAAALGGRFLFVPDGFTVVRKGASKTKRAA